ncbi:MAG: septum formation protein Maf [Clostridiales bacterium]|nr:septum formation protein Maf [Clostridiales bacterium]
MTSHAHTPLTLASASPRRRRLLALLGLGYDITAADTPETLDPAFADDPGALAMRLAAAKAHVARNEGARGLILAFDTIVVNSGELLGKPEDEAGGRAMLRSLSGRTHDVVTGVAMLAPASRDAHTFAVATAVRMRALSAAEIDTWLASDEFLGCAGAYNIESCLAEVDADQCFQNVAGLPLCHLYIALAQPEYRALVGDAECPVQRCDAIRHTRCALGPRLVAGAGGDRG